MHVHSFLYLQYGFVFGITHLAAFVFAPIFGRFGNDIGPKLLYNVGGFIQGFAGIAFGFLEYAEDTGTFLGLSYFLRWELFFLNKKYLYCRRHNLHFSLAGIACFCTMQKGWIFICDAILEKPACCFHRPCQDFHQPCQDLN